MPLHIDPMFRQQKGLEQWLNLKNILIHNVQSLSAFGWRILKSVDCCSYICMFYFIPICSISRVNVGGKVLTNHLKEVISYRYLFLYSNGLIKMETLHDKSYCVACRLQRRRHLGITIRHLASSQKISVIFFSGTTEASFLIFGTEHKYGELYRVTHF